MAPQSAEASAEQTADWRIPLAVMLSIAVVMTVTLLVMGRTPWWTCGLWQPWSVDIWSQHNSQHIIDPYTPTHVLHGVLFAGGLWVFRKWLSVWWRAAIAAGLEAIWEVVENTDRVIQHYRESTISLDYYGDSVINSVADLGACMAGFAFASSVHAAVSAGCFVLSELILALASPLKRRNVSPVIFVTCLVSFSACALRFSWL